MKFFVYFQKKIEIWKKKFDDTNEEQPDEENRINEGEDENAENPNSIVALPGENSGANINWTRNSDPDPNFGRPVDEEFDERKNSSEAEKTPIDDHNPLVYIPGEISQLNLNAGCLQNANSSPNLNIPENQDANLSGSNLRLECERENSSVSLLNG